MRVPMRGPGRPKKWHGKLVQWRADILDDDFDFIEETRAKLGLSRAEFIHMLLKQANINILELQAKVKHLEEALELERKEKQALLEERDKFIEKIEKLEFKLAAYEKGKQAVATRSSKIVKALAKAFEEGKTWAQVCEDVGIATPQEQIKLLHEFFVTKDDKGKFMNVFRPLKAVKAFRGWILVKGNAESIVDYVLARNDTLKAAQSLKKVEVEREEARAISIEQAKVDLRGKFFIIYSTYQKYLEAGKEKEALRFLQDVQDGFEKLVEKYGLDLIEDVVNEDFRFVELFGSLLSALKASKKKKPVEVVVDE